MPAIRDYIKKNVPKGAILGNAAFFGPEVVQALTSSENRFKNIAKASADIFLWTSKWTRGIMAGGIAFTGFMAIQKAVRSILQDTGSLEAAWKRLGAIQSFQRSFAPLVGGLNAAKQRVSELVALSARGPFQFEELAAASRTLQVFTRGTFSSTDALKAVGKVSMATGNDVQESASAIGQFYETLRNGEPISAAADHMREMGLISGETAQRLDEMSKSGQSVGSIFNTLTTEMEITARSGDKMSDSLQNVTAEHQKALEALKQKFGAPFVSSDVQNIKNYTGAMVAIAPTVQRTAGFLAIFTNALSTVRSTLVKAAAEKEQSSGIFEVITKGVVGAAAALALLFSVAAPFKFFALANAFAQWAKLTGVLRIGLLGVGAAAGSLLALTALAVVVGIIMNVKRAQAEEAKAVLDSAKAHAEATAAIAQHAAAMKTLADFHDVVAEAVQHEKDALNELIKKRSEDAADRKAKAVPFSFNFGPSKKPAIDEAQSNLDRAKAQKEKLLATPPNLSSEKQQEIARADAQRKLVAEEQAFQASLNAPGANRAELMRARAGVLRGREETGAAGRAASIKAELQRANLDALGAASGDNSIRRNRFDALSLQAGLKAPITSSVNLRTRAQMIRDAQALRVEEQSANPDQDKLTRLRMRTKSSIFNGSRFTERDAQMLDRRAELAETYERQTNPESPALSAAARAEQLQRNIGQFQTSNILGAAEARRSGRTGEAIKKEDLERFSEHFKENLDKFDPKEAASIAMRQTTLDIKASQPISGLPAVADSLARLGLGGGVYTPGGDAMQAIAKRQKDLQEQIYDLLKSVFGTNSSGVL